MTKKKQSKPLKSPATTKTKKEKKAFPALFDIISQQTPQERLIFFSTLKRDIIDSLKDSACKIPKLEKTIMVTEVIDKLNEFMISTKVQPYAEYPMAKIAGNKMDEARCVINIVLPTPVPAKHIFKVLEGIPPLVILLKNSKSNSNRSSFLL